MDTNEVVKRQILGSPETFHEPCAIHKRRTNNEEKALATYKNKEHVKELGGEAKTNTSMKVPHQP